MRGNARGTELGLLGGVLMLKPLVLYRGCSNGQGLFKPADLFEFLGLPMAFIGLTLELLLSWTGEFYPPTAGTR